MANHASFGRSAFAAALTFALVSGTAPLADAADVGPLRVLLITGGCCHDYANQKNILKKGLEERANVVVDQVHTADSTTHPALPILGNSDYATGYDLVIHDECAADISDPALVKGVLKPHRFGMPGVNLHCAMHSYRIGNPSEPANPGTPHGFWFEYLGLQSSGHGPQEPITITYTDKDTPISKGLADWTTIKEEHYNNVQVFGSARPVAHGKQTVKRRNGEDRTDEFVVAWVNEYGDEKTRVFSTTIGHNNETVADPRYLDLVTRGMLWAAGKLNDDGTPADGYGPGAK